MSERKYTVWVGEDNVSNAQGGEEFMTKKEAEELKEVWITNGWHDARILEEEV